jgi:hypothetical protein
MSSALVRVSLSVLLRIRDGDRYVLFRSNTRPGAFGPPGGVIKYYPPAVRVLDQLGFNAERRATREDVMKSDIRGLLPARSLGRFLRWFHTGAYREDAMECLRRELVEELTEIDLRQYVPDVANLTADHVRTVIEGPEPVTGQDYRQYRRFEIYDLRTTDATALRLADHLIDAGSSATMPTVLCASREDIAYGRLGDALIAPHAAFLVGSHRVHSDLPPTR